MRVQWAGRLKIFKNLLSDSTLRFHVAYTDVFYFLRIHPRLDIATCYSAYMAAAESVQHFGFALVRLYKMVGYV